MRVGKDVRKRHPPGRPGLRPHIRLLRVSRRSRHYSPSPGTEAIWTSGGAGLTSKPHRDRSTKSRLTWAVSPAAGIGLPGRTRSIPRGAPPDATTDPGRCHNETLAALDDYRIGPPGDRAQP